MPRLACAQCGADNSPWNSRCHACAAPLPSTMLAPDATAPGVDRAEAPLPAGTELGGYRLEERFGSGGMGVVYRATELASGRAVALKLLAVELLGDARARARLTREAQAVRALDHPSVAALYAVGEHEGRPYLVMELCHGVTLADKLAAGPLPVDRAIAVLAGIADALAAAHAAGIVHRDVKPANVMLMPDGGVKVLDFGLARVGAAAGAADATALTATGEVVGTLAYMAPEQLLGRAVDHRADLWALGVVAYEMIVGRPPFPGKLALRVLTTDITPVEELRPETPRAVGALVASLLQRDPARRPASAAEVARALRSARG